MKNLFCVYYVAIAYGIEKLTCLKLFVSIQILANVRSWCIRMFMKMHDLIIFSLNYLWPTVVSLNNCLTLNIITCTVAIGLGVVFVMLFSVEISSVMMPYSATSPLARKRKYANCDYVTTGCCGYLYKCIATNGNSMIAGH